MGVTEILISVARINLGSKQFLLDDIFRAHTNVDNISEETLQGGLFYICSASFWKLMCRREKLSLS